MLWLCTAYEGCIPINRHVIVGIKGKGPDGENIYGLLESEMKKIVKM